MYNNHSSAISTFTEALFKVKVIPYVFGPFVFPFVLVPNVDIQLANGVKVKIVPKSTGGRLWINQPTENKRGCRGEAFLNRPHVILLSGHLYELTFNGQGCRTVRSYVTRSSLIVQKSRKNLMLTRTY